jgi:hypothetical protein
MNPRWMSGIVLAAGLLTCGASFAQMGPMRAPMVPQAIGTHLEQKRTLEQREAIEAKAAAAPSPETTAPKKTSMKKSKKVKNPPAAVAPSAISIPSVKSVTR